MFLKIGTDGSNVEIASFTQLFSDLTTFKTTALADMEVKRADAETSAGEAETAETNAETAQSLAEAARDAAISAKNDAQTAAGIAQGSLPDALGEAILVTQLHSDLYNGSTL